MLTRSDENELSDILKKAIAGQISLDCRKRLAAGETVRVKLGENKLTIDVQNGKAFLKRGDDIVLETPFVPWDEVDDDYEAMIASFGDDGVDEEWFQRATSNYQSRFE